MRCRAASACSGVAGGGASDSDSACTARRPGKASRSSGTVTQSGRRFSTPQDHALERRARPRGEAREAERPVLVHDVAVARSRAHAGQRRVPDHRPQQAQGRQPRGLRRSGGGLGRRRDHPDDEVALHPHRRDDDQGQRRPAGQGHEQLAGEVGLERAEEEARAHRLHRDLLLREGGDDLLDVGAELHLGHALEPEAEDDRLAAGLHGARDPR